MVGQVASPMVAEVTVIPIAERKRALRKRARALRLVADQKEGPDAALAVARTLLAELPRFQLRAGAVIAGYWPVGTELDVRPLLARLGERGFTLALPAIVGGSDVLAFRRWQPTDALECAAYETRQPPASADALIPDLLLVPLLAVDGRGRRLGHGQGWYDRTLAALRAHGRPTAIGACYGLQVMEEVPADAHDQRVDWILSERGLQRVDA